MKVFLNSKLGLLALVLTLMGAKAQVFSPMQTISESPDDPLVVISEDFNNDGFDDVVYSSLGDNEISCNLFNPETGAFDDFILLGTDFHYCTSLFPADLDNDGLVDVLAVSQVSDKVGWYKNTGDGIFSLQPYLNEDATLAASVTAADVDLDGDMDVLSVQKTDNTVLLYLNDGSGDFSESIIVTASAQIPVVVTTADLNNDSYPDIIAGYGQTDKIVFFLNNGDGTFLPEEVITDQADFITNIVTADLDNDGNVDIVSVSKNDNKVAWYQNLDGNGSFSNQIIISQTLTNAYGLAVADFDLDGDTDIVASAPNDDKIYLFRNDSLDFHVQLVSSEVREPHGLASGDFNNDGLIDIAALDSWESGYTNKVYWFVNGKSCFVVHNINQIRSSWHLAMNDYDQDGDLDIFYSDGQYVCWVDNLGPGGSFSEEHILFDAGYNIWDLGFADADNDGFEDLFVADAMGDSFFWVPNLDGSGQFGAPVYIDTQGNGPASIDFSDIDGDNNMDVLMALVNDNKIVVYYNTEGNGVFLKTIVCDTVSPVSVCFIDYDIDGDDDIFYSDNNNIGFLNNDGNGGFSSGGIAVDYGTYSTSLSAEELNNDGYPDIVCAPDNTHWLINNQDGTFTDHEVETWGAAYNNTTGDLNNDGNMDIVSAAGTVNRAYYLRNINDGEGFNASSYAVDPDVRAVAIGDINNDGYDDITLGSWPAENLSWAENFYFRIINDPYDKTVCEGANVSFMVLTAGVLVFQWQMDDGSGWANIENNALFQGADKALLKINGVPQDLFGNEFRCVLSDDQDNSYFTNAATLTESQLSLSCVDDQVRTAGSSNTYTVVGNEFDPDTIINPCDEDLALVNDYNNLETLAGETFEIGNYTIAWTIENQQNEVVDTCSFELVIDMETQTPQYIVGELSISPNPFNDFLIIRLINGITPEKVEITDLRGKLVFQKEVDATTLKIKLDGLEQGVYFIRLKTESCIYVGKVVKR
ncbi:MAG: T9SS type A sorting domain-containing protein [Chlorobi bacterium]|nr:T9SS type A sorting domain-containing protein [Chlorobiota bacterium]